MTEKELEGYFWKVFGAPKDQTAARWNVRSFWNQIETLVYEKYGKPLMAPTNLCESMNPFTIHLNWDDKNGNVLGCSINEKSEIYTCFNKTVWLKDTVGFTTVEAWSELLYLPEIKASEKLMEVFYLYYLEKNNGH